ncbi:hypothetical protein DFH08DRAFT_1075802 [Mycena albidolilacea]|uniref:Uncharacterized protein n=1 Tax=Mycena albidolilacea TaxID=1033008 RepID=A0AAD7AFQ5_9AGAR|nr:hypothetical protein DFH08DRAFT_1075802 [Mycena albidolilacea]
MNERLGLWQLSVVQQEAVRGSGLSRRAGKDEAEGLGLMPLPPVPQKQMHARPPRWTCASALDVCIPSPGRSVNVEQSLEAHLHPLSQQQQQKQAKGAPPLKFNPPPPSLRASYLGMRCMHTAPSTGAAGTGRMLSSLSVRKFCLPLNPEAALAAVAGGAAQVKTERCLSTATEPPAREYSLLYFNGDIPRLRLTPPPRPARAIERLTLLPLPLSRKVTPSPCSSVLPISLTHSTPTPPSYWHEYTTDSLCSVDGVYDTATDTVHFTFTCASPSRDVGTHLRGEGAKEVFVFKRIAQADMCFFPSLCALQVNKARVLWSIAVVAIRWHISASSGAKDLTCMLQPVGGDDFERPHVPASHGLFKVFSSLCKFRLLQIYPKVRWVVHVRQFGKTYRNAKEALHKARSSPFLPFRGSHRQCYSDFDTVHDILERESTRINIPCSQARSSRIVSPMSSTQRRLS